METYSIFPRGEGLHGGTREEGQNKVNAGFESVLFREN